MKNVVLLVALTFALMSCEKKFSKEKYDVLITVKNATDETVELNVDEVKGRINWKKSLTPDEVYEIRFNIKKDIKASEGGFIFKATFPDGKSIEENTGYYTNFQIAGKSSQHYKITKERISEFTPE